MASIYSRKGILQVKYKTSDGWKQKSTGLIDTAKNRKSIQRELLPALEQHLKAKAEQGDKESIEKYARLYLLKKEDLKTYWEIQRRVEKIVEFFKNRDIREIKVSELRVWLRTFTVATKTIKSYVVDCKGIFQVALEEEILSKNPFVHIRVQSQDKESEDIEPFTPLEVEAILASAPLPLKNFLAIGFYTGMRSGEILGLQLSDIHKSKITIKRSVSKGKVSTPKTAKSIREVPLFDVLKPYLNSQIQTAREKKSFFLFLNGNKPLYGVDVIRGKKPYGVWAKLLHHLDIPYRKIYNTRHTFITAMLKSEKLSVLEIAQIVGHTNSKMIIENYARFIKGEHLKISHTFNPFQTNGDTRGDSRGDTKKTLSF